LIWFFIIEHYEKDSKFLLELVAQDVEAVVLHVMDDGFDG
jgi:hypothetical protein